MELDLDTRRKFGFFGKNLLSIGRWIAAAAIWNIPLYFLPEIGQLIYTGLSLLVGIVWLAWWEAGHKLFSAQIEEERTARRLAREQDSF